MKGFPVIPEWLIDPKAGRYRWNSCLEHATALWTTNCFLTLPTSLSYSRRHKRQESIEQIKSATREALESMNRQELSELAEEVIQSSREALESMGLEERMAFEAGAGVEGASA